MSTRTTPLTGRLYDWYRDTVVRDDSTLAALREETARLPGGGMQVAPEEGQFLALLVEMIGARRVVEIGTFTGYSALCMARALGPDGRLVACDVSEEWTAVARRHWRKAGVEDRIDLRLGPALDTLDGLLADGQEGQFDLAFIDADKTAYDAYYERCLALLRPGGVVTLDNMLWHGTVADPEDEDDDTEALRRLNAKIAGDDRVSMCLVPIGDGVMLARKRGS